MCSKNRRAVAKFLDYALSKPDVWVVTISQLLDWMESPVPAREVGSGQPAACKGCLALQTVLHCLLASLPALLLMLCMLH